MRAIGLILAGGVQYPHERTDKKSCDSKDCRLPVDIAKIDFVLSRCPVPRTNKVGVITQYNSKSLTQHLNSSKWWDFGRKKAVCLYSHRHRHMTIAIGTAEPQMPLHRILIF